LEAFSDGVLAIIITIMVLELRVPHDPNWSSLLPLVPTFLSYLLSFLYLAIYWNNHHHLLHAAGKINGAIMWANMHLLFWLSLVPFVTAWMGENHFAAIPTAAYGGIMFMAAIAYYWLQSRIIVHQGPDSILKAAIGLDWKGKVSPILYLVAIPSAFFSASISCAIYALLALIWFIPDRRIEKKMPG
jgi:uncharacterized membrane protein